MCALRPVTKGTPMTKAIMAPSVSGCICSVNKFEGLSEPDTIDEETVTALNEWGARVNQSTQIPQRQRKKMRATKSEHHLSNGNGQNETMEEAQSLYPKPDAGNLIVLPQTPPEEAPIIVRSEKDLPKLAGRMDALPSSSKGVAKAYKKVSGIQMKQGEVLCMVDSGSFVHAIDAEADLPGHDIEWFSESESNKGVAETACGGILRRLGLVRCKGTIGGHDVEIQWNHMRVKCPILSVLRLTKEGNQVVLRNDGGEIINLKSGKRIPFFQHNGVYYPRLQVKRPTGEPSESPLFSRRG